MNDQFNKYVLNTHVLNGTFSNNKGTYAVKNIISITNQKQPIPRQVLDLCFNLKHPCWDYYNKENNTRIPITPMEILNNTYNNTHINNVSNNIKEEFINHWIRIFDADLSYPIIIDENDWVVDGVHRLCQTYIKNITIINTVLITQQELDSIGSNI